MRRALIVLAIAVRATAARADDPLPLELQWDAPAGCPRADDVRAELARVVEIDPGRAPSTLRAAVAITRDGARLRLRIDTERDGERGQRTLVADDCGQVLRAVTLVLALAFGEGVALRADDPPAPPPVPSPSPSPTPTPSPSLTPSILATSSPRALHTTLGVEAGVATGVLPTAALESAVMVELAATHLGVRARLSLAAPETLAMTDGVHARFTGLGGSVDACGLAPRAHLRLDACAGLALATVLASATGTAADHDVIAPWLGVRGTLGAAWRMRALELRLTSTLVWNTARPRFAITGLGDVNRVDDVSLHLALGFAWRR
ncbi:MAG: hypothetical protein K8W52_31280 [Deltaproteobacteria bacterium]|nr:hypothetical protein [Deltaproteobacteria bacterium]